MREKEERHPIRKILYIIIFLLALLIFIFSAYKLFTIFKANWDEKQETEKINTISKIPTDFESDPTFSVDFEELSKINSDVRAWIVIPGTEISYPIVQGKDNSYYLNRTFEKQSNYAGAIFIDYRADSSFANLNTFVYGHNVKHGTMFAELEKFKHRDFYLEHPYIYIFTPEKKYRCPVMSMYSTEAGSDSYVSGHVTWEQFEPYVNLIKSKAEVKKEVAFTQGDRMITLSTCSYERGGVASEARYLLHAKLEEWVEEAK